MFSPGGLAPIEKDRQSTQPSAEIASPRRNDPITLSSEARAREAAASHPRFGSLSAAAHQSAELADQLAYDLANDVRGPMYDLSGLENGTGPMRYSATGEVVTPESEARYKMMAESFHSATLALYNKERANGTSSADIFDKLVALGDSQSAEYRNITDWEAKLG
jgi:hypothetical protein